MKNIIFLIIVLFATNTIAKDVKPFWTEKSSYIEGDNLYVVGIATEAASIEKGRKLAFENGKSEIMNFSQLSSIDGLPIATQMTYSELSHDKHTVYRLMFVSYEKLNSLISKKIKKSKENYARYQQKQEEEIQIKTIALTKIKKNNKELASLDTRFNKIAKNVETLSEKAIRYVKKGMTEREVKSLLGNPRTTYHSSGTPAHNYGKYWVVYGSAGNTVWCLSTSYTCVGTYYAQYCNDDKTICKKDGTISYHYPMIE